MNTLQDLRASLDQHAGDITADATTQARVSAVRARAVRLRRRQSGGVAAAAAAVAAVVAVTAWLPNGTPQPAEQDRTLLGREAPAEMSALGYTYAFEDGVESRDGASSIELERSDEPRLLTWAAEAGTVKLVGPGREARVSDGVEFDDWLVVPPGSEGVYTVHEDETALAVYELTDDRPAGTTVDGITFRDDVAGALLLDAAVADPGEGELSISFVAPGGEVRISSVCADGGRGVWVHIDIDGQRGGFSSGPACTDYTFDPGGGGGTTSAAVARPGERVTLRMYLTDGERGPRVDPADVRLGLGAYRVPEPVARVVPGFGTSELTEHDGHLWKYQRSVRGGRAGQLTVTNPGPAPLLVEGSFTAERGTTVVFEDGEQERTRYVGMDQGGGVRALLSSPGQEVTLRVRAVTPGLLMGFAIYERAD